MPSQFGNLLTASLDALYLMFGEAATHTAPDKSTASVTVRMHRNPWQAYTTTNAAGGTVAAQKQTATAQVRISELAHCVKGARFNVGGNEIWTVASTPKTQNGQHDLELERISLDRLNERRSA